jgi:signal peptidase I
MINSKTMLRLPIIIICFVLVCGLWGCGNKTPQEESREAKALLQGTWIDRETEGVLFRLKGDTVYYADSTSMPAYFKVVGDTLYIGKNASYHIEKHTDHLLWFKNQNGELMKLEKVDEEELQDVAEAPQPKTTIQTLTEVLKRDTVVFKDGQRYHCYIAINPTHYKVLFHTVNEDGLGVDEVFYDNIVNISIFKGTSQIFKSDIHKQDYRKLVNGEFLGKAILNDMNFINVDSEGFHFTASLCLPNGASSYLVDNIISEKGDIHLKLFE